jgi:hypothetical protein
MQNSAAQPFSATVKDHAGSVPCHSGKVFLHSVDVAQLACYIIKIVL